MTSEAGPLASAVTCVFCLNAEAIDADWRRDNDAGVGVVADSRVLLSKLRRGSLTLAPNQGQGSFVA